MPEDHALILIRRGVVIKKLNCFNLTEAGGGGRRRRRLYTWGSLERLSGLMRLAYELNIMLQNYHGFFPSKNSSQHFWKLVQFSKISYRVCYSSQVRNMYESNSPEKHFASLSAL